MNFFPIISYLIYLLYSVIVNKIREVLDSVFNRYHWTKNLSKLVSLFFIFIRNELSHLFNDMYQHLS